MDKEQLYRENIGLIKSIAFDSAKAFNRVRKKDSNTNEYTDYTKEILSELESEGALSFLKNIDEYNPDKAKLSTFIFPYLKGDMYRWLERNIGSVSLSKDEMMKIRKAQYLYNDENKTITEISEAVDIPLADIDKYINYNTHFLSVYDLLSDNDSDTDVYDILQSKKLSMSAERIVYKKICMELLEELFLSLPVKEKSILGRYFGAFGHKKSTLNQIALDEMMTVDGVLKAKNKALKHIRKMYIDSKLKQWKDVYKLINKYIYENK